MKADQVIRRQAVGGATQGLCDRKGPGHKWGLSALRQEPPRQQTCQMVTISSRACPHLPWV